jgi:DDE family transposase
MKQAWCLATSGTDETAKALMKLYGKRWGIECGFRDTKDLRFWDRSMSAPRHAATVCGCSMLSSSCC